MRHTWIYEGLLSAAKKQITERNGSDDADEVGQQHCTNGIAGVLHGYCAEVNGDDVERGIGRALENAREPSCKRVWTEILHRVNHHSPRTAAA